jgi:hypothetical protein
MNNAWVSFFAKNAAEEEINNDGKSEVDVEKNGKAKCGPGDRRSDGGKK